MSPKVFEIKLARFHEINLIGIYLSIIGWIIAIAVMLALDLPNEQGDIYYKPVSAIMLTGILLYGILNIWFGLVKELGLDTILKTTLALFFSVVGFSAIGKSEHAFLYFSISTSLYGLIIAAIYGYFFAFKKETSKETKITADASIRGIQSIFVTGSDSYKLVRRNNLENTSPAKDFENKLVRYLEKKLARSIYSMFGDGTNYWKFSTPSGPVEFMVVANDLNISRPLNPKNKWLLRIREDSLGVFSKWISEHFPAQEMVVRKLPDDKIQVQFAASQLEHEMDFFKATVSEINDNRFEAAVLTRNVEFLSKLAEESGPSSSKMVH